MKLSIVIPVYNEERHVLDVLRPGHQVRAERAQVEPDHRTVGPRGDPVEDPERVPEQTGEGTEATVTTIRVFGFH